MAPAGEAALAAAAIPLDGALPALSGPAPAATGAQAVSAGCEEAGQPVAGAAFCATAPSVAPLSAFPDTAAETVVSVAALSGDAAIPPPAAADEKASPEAPAAAGVAQPPAADDASAEEPGSLATSSAQRLALPTLAIAGQRDLAKPADAPEPAGDAAPAGPKHATTPKANTGAESKVKTDPAQAEAGPPDKAAVAAREQSTAPDAAQRPAPPVDAARPSVLPQQVAQTVPAQAQAAAVGLPQLAVTIAARARAGERHYEIRLDPPELGRIEVALSVDKTNTTTTVLTVERMDTLDLLQRDSRALERALTTAGFKTEQGSLQFNLRDQGGNAQGFAGQNPGQGSGGEPRRFLFADAGFAPEPLRRTTPLAIYAGGLVRPGGLDIRV
jgi:hypothetical protein